VLYAKLNSVPQKALSVQKPFRSLSETRKDVCPLPSDSSPLRSSITGKLLSTVSAIAILHWMPVRLLMKDSLGRSGDACHQGPRTGPWAVPQHTLAQFRARSQEPGLGSRYCDAQARGEIMHRQLFHVAHHYDLPQEWRNSPDLSIQDSEHLAFTKFALGIGLRRRHLDGSVPALGIGVI
jgi:hypothetical protein